MAACWQLQAPGLLNQMYAWQPDLSTFVHKAYLATMGHNSTQLVLLDFFDRSGQPGTPGLCSKQPGEIRLTSHTIDKYTANSPCIYMFKLKISQDKHGSCLLVFMAQTAVKHY